MTMPKTSTDKVALTKTQQRVFDYIRDFRDERGFCVSFREIGERFGWSLNGVSCHIDALKRKGFVTWEHGQSRTLRPIR